MLALFELGVGRVVGVAFGAEELSAVGGGIYGGIEAAREGVEVRLRVAVACVDSGAEGGGDGGFGEVHLFELEGLSVVALVGSTCWFVDC